ncbi:MAG: hypothetical protein P1P76_08545 [Anaerolineales bacterium]|nr:hypothetical protein [Anaerolineales bacterium]
MKVIVVYESAYGTTKSIAGAFAGGIGMPSQRFSSRMCTFEFLPRIPS